jgi:hypothetical protein
MFQVKSIISVVFVASISVGLIGVWVSSADRTSKDKSMPHPLSAVDMTETALMARYAFNDSSASKPGASKPQADKEVSMQQQSLHKRAESSAVVNLVQECTQLQEAFCRWVAVLNGKAEQGQASSLALLGWIANEWIDRSDAQNIDYDRLEWEMKQALLQDDQALEDYRQAVKSFLDQDIANQDLETLKHAMQNMESHIFEMKLQGMTEAEAELVRIRLIASKSMMSP